ncbi:MAG: DUF177 domain-containing protein [Xanthobacteraceae bacterium]|nr:DUF177 domain-containing protein [Xanthobacteraceae bacterium]
MTEHQKHPAADSPWSMVLLEQQIPDAGLRCEFEADEAQRTALAQVAGLRDIAFARAAFDLRHAGGGKLHVMGRVSARVGQTCVVTLDPIESDIDEQVDLMFVPESDLKRFSDMQDAAAEETGDMPDPPEPIVNGRIDLGRVATDALFLGIDPYPRKSGTVFAPPAEAIDPEEHPFAALKALREGSDPKDSGGS